MLLIIIEDYRPIELRKDNTIISNEKIVKKILPIIDIDSTYKIGIPNVITYVFKVYGYKIATMKSVKK